MTDPRRRPGRPPTGRAQSAAERMRRYRARQRAAGLRMATRWQPARPAAISPGALKHRIIEARSLAMHCLIARKIEADRRLLAAARRNLPTWIARHRPRAPGDPALADRVDGAIGEGSRFHEQYGYYAQGVAPDTATLPRGWQRRLVRIENSNTGGYAGLCLEVHDLALSKYVAGREKDREFTRELARPERKNKKTLLERLSANRLRAAASR